MCNRSSNRLSRRYHPYPRRDLDQFPCHLLRFQKRAAVWMKRHRCEKQARGVILNMDYGLGKTVTSLAHAAMFGWNAVYLCPPNIVAHVMHEVKKHFGSTITCLEAKRWDPNTFDRYDLTILSYYHLARLDTSEMQSCPHVFTTCIIDELEDAIKKKQVAAITKSFISARFYIGLTGAKRIQEPMMLLARVVNKSSVFVFRQQVSFVQTTHMIELDESSREKYHDIQQQIMNAKGLVANNLLVSARKMISIQKSTEVLFLLSQMQHCKVLVVTEFIATLEHIASQLVHYKQNHILFIATKLKPEKRDEALRVFTSNSKMNIMLADSALIGFGLDFGFVDVLIMIDLPRELLFYRQLQGRLRRVGQHPKQLQRQEVIELVTKNTCDHVLFKDIHSSQKYNV